MAWRIPLFFFSGTLNMGTQAVLSNLIRSGKYKSEEDFAKKECSAIEWTSWWVGGMSTCVTRFNTKQLAKAAANSGVAKAIAKDTGYTDRQNRLAEEEKKRKEAEAAKKKAQENARTNFVEAELDVEEARKIEAQYLEKVQNQKEIIMQSDWDEFLKEIVAFGTQMSTILKRMEQKEKQAKAGGYSEEMAPLVSSVREIYNKIDDAHKIVLPKKWVNVKEPLTIRDSKIDFYNENVEFETECNKNFEELAKMTEVLEGTELSSEGRRKLLAVVNCPVKSKVGLNMNSSAKKYIDMANEIKPDRKSVV